MHNKSTLSIVIMACLLFTEPVIARNLPQGETPDNEKQRAELMYPMGARRLNDEIEFFQRSVEDLVTISSSLTSPQSDETSLGEKGKLPVTDDEVIRDIRSQLNVTILKLERNELQIADLYDIKLTNSSDHLFHFNHQDNRYQNTKRWRVEGSTAFSTLQAAIRQMELQTEQSYRQDSNEGEWSSQAVFPRISGSVEIPSGDDKALLISARAEASGLFDGGTDIREHEGQQSEVDLWPQKLPEQGPALASIEGQPEGFNELSPIGQGQLGENRGGFVLDNGVKIDFNIIRAGFIDGVEQFRSKLDLPTNVNLSSLSRVRPGLATTNSTPVSSITPEYSTVNVLQNSLNNRTITDITSLNIRIENFKIKPQTSVYFPAIGNGTPAVFR